MTKMESPERKETALPVIGGVFNVVSGVSGLIGGIILLIISYLGEELDVDPTGITFLVVLGIVLPIFGAIAIYGGICAVRREKFERAIVGAIFALLSFFILGIIGLILIIVARDEFK
ncbi:MAG: hypothetical protein U9N41_09480 [Euryarchaeota archaeon]|nr:hypothetical protein [Euryarchaeota archaeon]